MKKPAILCVVVLIALLSVVSIVGCQQEQEPEPTPTTPTPLPTTGTKTYTGHGASFDYPEDWVTVGTGDDPEALWTAAFEERGEGIVPGVTVAAFHMEGMTLREFEQAHLWAFTNRNYITSIADVTINGRDAIRYTWTAELDGLPVKGDDLYITKDYEVVYYASCYSLTSEYPTSQDAFNMLHNSFKIE